MSLTVLALDQNYLKLRHQLAAAGYTLAISTESVPEKVAQYAGAICEDCSNRLSYQEWAGPDGQRAYVVCMVCYQAAALD